MLDTIEGAVSYSVCEERGCLIPDVEFEEQHCDTQVVVGLRRVFTRDYRRLGTASDIAAASRSDVRVVAAVEQDFHSDGCTARVADGGTDGSGGGQSDAAFGMGGTAFLYDLKR